MPYVVDWLDEDLRVVSVRLYDPLQQDDIKGLQNDLEPVIEETVPVFVLIDIREMNPMKGLTSLGTVLSDLQNPGTEEYHLKNSRVAIIGGGTMISFILKMVESDEIGEDIIRAFKYEDKALTWLREMAQQATGASQDDIWQ